MECQIGQKLPRPHAPRIRRTLLCFLAFTYLFVGLFHLHAPSYGANSVAIALNSTIGSGGDSEKDGSNKSSVVDQHCGVCAPSLLPVQVAVSGDLKLQTDLYFPLPKLLQGGQTQLDTPPPKDLT